MYGSARKRQLALANKNGKCRNCVMVVVVLVDDVLKCPLASRRVANLPVSSCESQTEEPTIGANRVI